MDENGHYSKEYYVIFKKTALKKWYMSFLYEPFGHVLLATKTEMGHFWVITDYKGGNMFTELIPMESLRKIYPRSVIMPFKSVVHKEPQFRLWFINCVEIAKSMLGIRAWGIITPFQLYRYIRRSHENGRSIKSWSKEGQENRAIDEEAKTG